MYIYVITHPSSKDMVEVFKLKENNALKYKRTITDPLFRGYVFSLVHYYPGKNFRILLESLLSFIKHTFSK